MSIIISAGLVLINSGVLGSIIIFKARDSQTAKVPDFLVGIGSKALVGLAGLVASIMK